MPDPTLNAMARFSDNAQWDHIERGVPIFVEHEMYEVAGPDGRAVSIPVLPGNKPPDGAKLKYRVDKDVLQFVADKINANFQENGKPMKLFIGHTLPPGAAKQEDQPELVGYAVNAMLTQWGPKGTLGILVDKYFEKGKFEQAKKYPERSPEFNPITGDMTALALLKTEPKLPMGMCLYGWQGFDQIVRYGHGFDSYQENYLADPEKYPPTSVDSYHPRPGPGGYHPSDPRGNIPGGVPTATAVTRSAKGDGNLPTAKAFRKPPETSMMGKKTTYEAKDPAEPVTPDDEDESMSEEETKLAKKMMKYMQKYGMSSPSATNGVLPDHPKGDLDMIDEAEADVDIDAANRKMQKGADKEEDYGPLDTTSLKARQDITGKRAKDSAYDPKPSHHRDEQKASPAEISREGKAGKLTDMFNQKIKKYESETLPAGLRIEGNDMPNELTMMQYQQELATVKQLAESALNEAKSAKVQADTFQEKYALAESQKMLTQLIAVDGYRIKNPDKLALEMSKMTDEQRKAKVAEIRENYSVGPTGRLPHGGDFLPISFDHVEGADGPLDDSLTEDETMAAVHYAEAHKLNPRDDEQWEQAIEAIKAKRTKIKPSLNGAAK